MNDVYQHM